MQCIDLRSVYSNKIIGLDQRLCTHTKGDKDWLHGSTIAYVCGAEPRCKVFTIYQLGYNWA